MSAREAARPGPPLAQYDVYGYEFQVRGSLAEATEGIAADFAYFRRDHVNSPATLELLDEDPPYADAPPLRATVYTPRNVSYRDGDVTYVDYSGRALATHNRKTGAFRISSRNADLAYEAAYLFLLSQIAEALDARHLHRIHALGLSVGGKAVLVLLPMGGGKSTLGSELLKYPEVGLLSDDSPFVDRAGRLFCFPLRLGLLPGSETHVPERQLRRINRMEFGPKLLVNYSHFASRVVPSAEPGFVFVGQRSLDTKCRILPASRGEALRAMMVNCVVGLGLYQGMEFVFQRSPAELAGKAGIAWSRMRNSMRLLRRSQTCRLVLGRDLEANGRAIMDFVRRSG